VIPVSLGATTQRTSDTRQFYGRESNEQSLDEVAVVRRDVPEVETTQFWVDAGTARLFVSAGGVGEPILLLHGGMASHAAVEPLARHWREQSQVITPDLRSNGASHYGGSISFDLLSTDLGLVLDALQLNHAIVAGVSSGAAVALAFALRAPHRTSRLVLITPSHAGSAAGLSEPQRAAFNRLLAAAERAALEGIDAMKPLYAELPDGVRQRALNVLRSFDPASILATARFLASGAQPFDSLPELRSITAPTLIISGNDPMHPADVASRLADAIPNCELLPPGTDAASAALRFLAAPRQIG
jgi:pimeloyl-ACP methyl ester carboxylesterase